MDFKQQHNNKQPPKKAKVGKSAKKIMYIFFMDSQGMLLQHPVPSGQTVNKEYYRKVNLFYTELV